MSEYHCSNCGKLISKEEYKLFDGLCEDCWYDEDLDEQLDEDILGR
jgi:NMD protein affecting ribosome stability and mRNA decay